MSTPAPRTVFGLHHSSSLGRFGYRGHHDAKRRAAADLTRSSSASPRPGAPRTADALASPTARTVDGRASLPPLAMRADSASPRAMLGSPGGAAGLARSPDEQGPSLYLMQHSIRRLFEELTAKLILDRPDDPVGYLADMLDARRARPRAQHQPQPQQPTAAAAAADTPSRPAEVPRNRVTLTGSEASPAGPAPRPSRAAGAPVAGQLAQQSSLAGLQCSNDSYLSDSATSPSLASDSCSCDGEADAASSSATPAGAVTGIPRARAGTSVRAAAVEHHVTESTKQDDDTLRINQYSVLEVIGKGAQGEVFRVVDTSNPFLQEFALKVMRAGRVKKILRKPLAAPPPGATPSSAVPTPPAGDAMHELAVMKKLNHPNVVKLKEIIAEERKDRVYLVLEYMRYGSLLDRLAADPAGRLPLADVYVYARDIVLGLEYLHAQGVIHRDLKPDNLLIDALGVVKIADFGVSQMFDGSDASLLGSMGTPAYFAPELCSQTGGSKARRSGKAVDIWALGVCLFQFLFGRLPFEPIKNANPFYTQKVLFEAIASQELAFPAEPAVDTSLRDMLSALLTKEAGKRVSLAKLKQHAWLTRDGTDPLPKQSLASVHVTYSDISAAVTRAMARTSNVLMAGVRFKRGLRRVSEGSTPAETSPEVSQTEGVPVIVHEQ